MVHSGSEIRCEEGNARTPFAGIDRHYAPVILVGGFSAEFSEAIENRV